MRSNFWFDEQGKPKVPTVACINNIVLFDRRELGDADPWERDRKSYGGKPCPPERKPWLVYCAADTKFFGEYTCHATWKAAMKDLISRAGSSPCDTVFNIVPDKVKKALGTRDITKPGFPDVQA